MEWVGVSQGHYAGCYKVLGRNEILRLSIISLQQGYLDERLPSGLDENGFMSSSTLSYQCCFPSRCGLSRYTFNKVLWSSADAGISTQSLKTVKIVGLP